MSPNLIARRPSMESTLGAESLTPPASPVVEPDIMNDPAYNSNVKGKEKDGDDVDTCRICRGEGSHEEPLFYPCRCSGSIKFVHQSCLMEWLAHSQKKHCELCKTPFRFTKLYHPQMPNTVPIPIFLHQAALHGWKTFKTWIRFQLVFFVWVFWLPWCMRTIWRGLFWVGDGGWVDWSERERQTAMSRYTGKTDLLGSGTEPGDVRLSSSKQAGAAAFMDFFGTKAIKMLSSNPWLDNPLRISLEKLHGYIFGQISAQDRKFASTQNATEISQARPRSSTWLSDLPFLNKMTPSTTINNMIIDILEGQLITLFVVVAFILIFLIREWVMQQQQNMLLGPGGDNQEARGPNLEAPAQLQPRQGGPEQNPVEVGPGDNGPRPRLFVRPGRRLNRHIPPAVVHPPEDQPARPTGGDPIRDAPNTSAEKPVEFQGTQISRPVTSSQSLLPPKKNEKEDSVVGEDEDFESLDASGPGSRNGAMSRQVLVDSPSWMDNLDENLQSLESPNNVQDNRNEAPRDSESGCPSSMSNSETVPLLPSKSQLPARPAWTFNDALDDSSDFQYTPQESSDEASPPINQELEGGLIDESQMVENPNSDDLASNGAEDAYSTTSPIGPDSQDLLGESSNSLVIEAPQDQGYVEAVINWLWGNVTILPAPAEQPAGDDEHIVNDLANEAPFVPVAHGHHLLHPPEEAENRAQDPEVLAAAAEAGIDPNEAEGVDEIEDLEGIMELIGMEGPLAGLMQNGMFCAVLVTLTIFFGVWIPYMSGKVFLTLLANPVTLFLRFLRLTSTGADIVVDIIVFVAAGALYWTDITVNFLCMPAGRALPALSLFLDNKVVAQASASYAKHAFERLVRISLTAGEGVSEGIDVPALSVIAHESLRHIESQLAWFTKVAIGSCTSFVGPLLQCSSTAEVLRLLSLGVVMYVKAISAFFVESLLTLASVAPSLLRADLLKFNLAVSHRSTPFDFDLAAWDATDRSLAIVAGYAFFALLGVLYLYLAGALRGTNKKGAIVGGLAQVLYQAGGVMKVILIISIEMILFPLYCGLLLDLALLPLFGNVNLMSRVNFTATSPWTSVFVHWFVGTCYMFHFALFVSMCRKILRSGVLYFIRDPDDPTFHPVRDVLERSVSSQLWKISFSALVYGGLVLVCLGGVVWGIAYTFTGVFPIHWSSDEPVLEFPVDLLFYNFLMPMAVKIFKPSIGLNKIYGWWFRKCARALRLSSFLFNDTRSDEEGRHVRRTWTDVLHGEQGDVRKPVIGQDRQVLAEDRGVRAIFLRDGKYVRTPGSDQVRIPKGTTTFIEVDEEDKRLDGIKGDDEDPQGRKMNLFMKVYIPPFFRTRIAVFISLIWLFAAVTGVGITIIPLLFGRWVFAKLTPNHLRMNDIYAFCMGIYVLGITVWALLNHRRITNYIYAAITPHTTSLTSAFRKAKSITLYVLGLVYAYSALGILLPCLFSLLLEFYIIIPLHTYLLNNADVGNIDKPIGDAISTAPYPVIHIIQDWTLGVLYIKMFARLILWTAPSRPALALRAIVARGWLNPDIRLATRAFIFPATLVMLFTLLLPVTLGWAANHTVLHAFSKDDALARASVYRYSYPAVLALGLIMACLWLAGRLLEGWRRRIRDEVYLIGERLHNFGEGARTGAMSRVRVGKMPVGRAQ